LAANLIRLCIVLISWSTLLFLPKKSFHRYLPVSIFCSFMVIIVSLFALRYRWWSVKGSIAKLALMDLSFIYGPFFSGTLWIFHFCFGKFKRYLLLNGVMDALLAFPLNAFFQKSNVYKLQNFKPIYIFTMYYAFAIFIYGYQLLIDRSAKMLRSKTFFFGFGRN